MTNCGRICLGRKKINFSTVFAGQAVGIKEVQDDIWLLSFMDYDLGYFDRETRVLEPLENPFGPKVLPMSQVRCVTHVLGLDPTETGAPKGTILELSSATSCQHCPKVNSLLDGASANGGTHCIRELFLRATSDLHACCRGVPCAQPLPVSELVPDLSRPDIGIINIKRGEYLGEERDILAPRFPRCVLQRR